MHPLARRILRLARGRDKQPPVAWLNPGETTERARVRWCSEHPDKDPATVTRPSKADIAAKAAFCPSSGPRHNLNTELQPS
jgi:hypothetical protein